LQFNLQLKDDVKNYYSFLLEAAAIVWDIDVFSQRNFFIIFTDHKLLQKLGHLHTKPMSRSQTDLLEHNFLVQCIKPDIFML